MNISDIVKRMILLRRFNGKCLLPCPKTYNFEVHFSKVVKSNDFLNYPSDYKFQTIIGILPDISYLNKCLNHLDRNGELIVCTEPGFYCPLLNKKLHALGTITDIINIDNHIIWRFAKDDFSHRTLVDGLWKTFSLIDEKLIFFSKDYCVPFLKFFNIKTGAVSGLDEAFINPGGNVNFVNYNTLQTGITKRMFFNSFDESLVKHKDKLLGRKVGKFREDNWWMWCKSHYISEEQRIYVPCRTKSESPFFHHESIHYDGTVLAIFYKGKMKPAKVVNLLNKVDWVELGFKVGKKFIFNKKSLSKVLLPKDFEINCI